MSMRNLCLEGDVHRDLGGNEHERAEGVGVAGSPLDGDKIAWIDLRICHELVSSQVSAGKGTFLLQELSRGTRLQRTYLETDKLASNRWQW